MAKHARIKPALEPRRARGRPKAEDVAELEARLIRVARRCFVTHGYGATSMNEIARAARVSKGTLYARFPTKADLFRAIIDLQIQRAGDRLIPPGPKAKTLEDALRTYAENALRDSVGPEIMPINQMIYSEARRLPELGKAAWARSRVGVRHVSEVIREYAELEGVPCRDPETAAELFTTLLRGWYSDLMLRGRPVTGAEIRTWTRTILKVFLAGRNGW